MTISAQQYLCMRAMVRGALAANSFLVANPSDGEVLGFFSQLTTEASGAAALSAPQRSAIAYAFRGVLSGNFPGVANPSDAQVLDFWTQLSTDSNGASSLAADRYKTLKAALLGRMSLNYQGASNPSLQDMLGYFGAVLNAVTPASILGSAPQWWIDGSAGTLTDAGAGLCSAWGDSSGNGRNFTAAGAGRPTIITGGLNSKNTVRFTTSNFMTATFQSPVPGTTPSYFWFVINITNVASSRVINAGADADQAIYNATGSLKDFCGSNGPQSPVLTAAFVFLECFRSNSATDYLTINGVVGSLASATNGAATSTILTLNAGPGGVSAGNSEIAEAGQWFGADPGNTKRTAMRAYVTAKWGV